MSARNKKENTKGRNWLAVHAHQRKGAGAHRDRKRDYRRGNARKPKHANKADTRSY